LDFIGIGSFPRAKNIISKDLLVKISKQRTYESSFDVSLVFRTQKATAAAVASLNLFPAYSQCSNWRKGKWQDSTVFQVSGPNPGMSAQLPHGLQII
jgi:hypothetical protein